MNEQEIQKERVFNRLSESTRSVIGILLDTYCCQSYLDYGVARLVSIDIESAQEFIDDQGFDQGEDKFKNYCILCYGMDELGVERSTLTADLNQYADAILAELKI